MLCFPGEPGEVPGGSSGAFRAAQLEPLNWEQTGGAGLKGFGEGFGKVLARWPGDVPLLKGEKCLLIGRRGDRSGQGKRGEGRHLSASQSLGTRPEPRNNSQSRLSLRGHPRRVRRGWRRRRLPGLGFSRVSPELGEDWGGVECGGSSAPRGWLQPKFRAAWRLGSRRLDPAAGAQQDWQQVRSKSGESTRGSKDRKRVAGATISVGWG